MAKKHWCWVAYPCYIDKVQVKRKGLSGHELYAEEDEMKEPYTVVDEEGEEFVVDKSRIYASPVAAEEAMVALAQKYEVDCPDDDEDDEGVEEEDEEG